MLSHLSIRNIALIDTLDLEFPNGFVVMTGETGAGKSILIDSVNLLLGERADRGLIQNGATKAVVEALFDELGTETLAVLSGIDMVPDDGQLILSRELTDSGKNPCRINGHLSNLSLLKQISDTLVDLHGQHEHQALLHASTHLYFLDSYAGQSLIPLLATYQDAWQQWRDFSRSYKQSLGDEAERARRRDILRFQIDEIEAAELKIGEEADLRLERDLLANREQIQTALGSALVALDGDEDSMGARSLCKAAADHLQAVSGINDNFHTLYERLNDSYYQLENLAEELQAAADIDAFDPYRYDEIELRLSVLSHLGKKYGSTTQDILSFAESAQNELAQLDEKEDMLQHGEETLQVLTQQCYSAALALHQKRQEAAEQLGIALHEQLADLGMEKARFHVHFDEISAVDHVKSFSENGLDSVEFLLSANANESLRPLQKVASGGELSRIMLAFKTIFASSAGCNTLIFDEIDTGISGQTAHAVGQKMLNIANERQVICVTHSPQIVAFADYHMKVWKEENNGHVRTQVKLLSQDEHIDELARLISGDAPSKKAREHAQELIISART